MHPSSQTITKIRKKYHKTYGCVLFLSHLSTFPLFPHFRIPRPLFRFFPHSHWALYFIFLSLVPHLISTFLSTFVLKTALRFNCNTIRFEFQFLWKWWAECTENNINTRWKIKIKYSSKNVHEETLKEGEEREQTVRDIDTKLTVVARVRNTITMDIVRIRERGKEKEKRERREREREMKMRTERKNEKEISRKKMKRKTIIILQPWYVSQEKVRPFLSSPCSPR